MIDFNDPACAKNLTANRPLHYNDIYPGLLGNWIMEMAKDIAAVDVLHHLEEAEDGRPPECETYVLALKSGAPYYGYVQWWSPTPG